MWLYPTTPPHLSSAQPPSSTKPGGICLSVLTKTSLAALTSAPSDTSGWTECRLRSGTYRLFAALVATKKPIPAAIVLYLLNFFSFFIVLQARQRWGHDVAVGDTLGVYVFRKLFPFACLSASWLPLCQVHVPFSPTMFLLLFFPSTSCPYIFSAAFTVFTV